MPENSFASERSNGKDEVATKVKSSFDAIQEKASELGNKAADALGSSRTSAAQTMDNAAASIHAHADSLPGGEKVAHFAHDAADTIGSTAQYVRSHGTKEVMADVEVFVKAHPGQCLAAAAAIGFLAGRAFRRD